MSETRALKLAEAPMWKRHGAGWLPVFGSIDQLGFSIEWHDIKSSDPIDWEQSFHPKSLEICLNLLGEGEVTCGRDRLKFTEGTVGFYCSAGTPIRARRKAGQQHQFVTVEVSFDFLGTNLPMKSGNLHAAIQSSLGAGRSKSAVSAVQRMTASHQQLVKQLRQPPVVAAALPLWYRGKVLELISEFLFTAPTEDLFCTRQKRVAIDRVERVTEILRSDLVEPPNLDSIAREVGCSPYYLSRIFSQEMKMTIPQYLRQIRIEKAAELLESGKFNVTEAAMEVGYNSVSHFSQAFCQTMGCCPAMYPLPNKKSK